MRGFLKVELGVCWAAPYHCGGDNKATKPWWGLAAVTTLQLVEKNKKLNSVYGGRTEPESISESQNRICLISHSHQNNTTENNPEQGLQVTAPRPCIKLRILIGGSRALRTAEGISG